MRFYDFWRNSAILTYALMVFWLTSFYYMSTSSVIASEQDTSPISSICVLAQRILSSETGATVDKQFATQIINACETDSRRLMIVWDIHTITEDLFLIQEPLLFESVLYILPRNHWEKWDFIHILEQHKDDVLKRLESSQTKMSHFLRTRFLLDRFSVLWGTSNKKELIKVIQWWQDYTDIYTPYIDAWSYFLLGTSLEPHLTFEQVTNSHDIFINWSSVKYLWNRKQALMAIRENMPWTLVEALDNMRTIQSHLWGSPLIWLLSSDFVAAFAVHPEFLSTVYFDPSYIIFIEDTIVLTSWLKGTSLPTESKKYLAIVDQLIALIESQKLGSWEKISKQWYTGGSPLYPIVDVLMTLASAEGDIITSLISRHQSFFEQDEMIPYRDNIEKAIKNSKKNTLTWAVQFSTSNTTSMSGHSMTDSHQSVNHPDTIDTQKNQWFLYGLFGCISLFFIAILIFFIKKHQ